MSKEMEIKRKYHEYARRTLEDLETWKQKRWSGVPQNDENEGPFKWIGLLEGIVKTMLKQESS